MWNITKLYSRGTIKELAKSNFYRSGTSKSLGTKDNQTFQEKRPKTSKGIIILFILYYQNMPFITTLMMRIVNQDIFWFFEKSY